MLLRRFGWLVLSVCVLASGAVGQADGSPYQLDGYWYDVDYWAGTGANETVIVVDWNDTNGPYVTEAHAFGYRWDESATVLDALNAIAAAGAFDFLTGFGGGFVTHAFYNDGTDNHTNQSPTDYNGWVWAGDSTDGGATWVGNNFGVDVETLAVGTIEGINLNPGDWTGENLTVPVPEPATIAVALGGATLVLLRRRG